MRSNRRIMRTAFFFLALGLLILDAKTAIAGAKEGLDLCLNSVIPSLLPFCILTKLICSGMIGQKIPLLEPIVKKLGIPPGAESIFILSLIGGYPIGAQCVNDAYVNKAIDEQSAERLLSFCNNAGPAFIFGILNCLFPTSLPLWVLYITRALLTALLCLRQAICLWIETV